MRVTPRPLVLLHGFTGAPSVWDRVLDRGPAGREVERPWMIGHGPEPVTSPTTWEEEIARLASRIEGRFGGASVDVVGYSMGARLAVGLVVARPELVASTTWIGGSPGIADPEERRARRRLDEERARGLEREGLDAFVDDWGRLELFATQMELPPGLREEHDRRRRAHRAAGLAHALRVVGTGSMPDLWARLPDVRCPVDLVAGERDPRFVALARRMARELPEARVHVVAGSGHDVVLEAPGPLASILVSRSRAGESSGASGHPAGVLAGGAG